MEAIEDEALLASFMSMVGGDNNDPFGMMAGDAQCAVMRDDYHQYSYGDIYMDDNYASNKMMEHYSAGPATPVGPRVTSFIQRNSIWDDSKEDNVQEKNKKNELDPKRYLNTDPLQDNNKNNLNKKKKKQRPPRRNRIVQYTGISIGRSSMFLKDTLPVEFRSDRGTLHALIHNLLRLNMIRRGKHPPGTTFEEIVMATCDPFSGSMMAANSDNTGSSCDSIKGLQFVVPPPLMSTNNQIIYQLKRVICARLNKEFERNKTLVHNRPLNNRPILPKRRQVNDTYDNVQKRRLIMPRPLL